MQNFVSLLLMYIAYLMRIIEKWKYTTYFNQFQMVIQLRKLT